MVKANCPTYTLLRCVGDQGLAEASVPGFQARKPIIQLLMESTSPADKCVVFNTRCLQPGGWIVIQYIDYHVFYQDETVNKTEDLIYQFWDAVNRGLEVLGVDHTTSNKDQMLNLVEHAGFQHVTEQSWVLPIGTWAANKRLKEVGRWLWWIMDEWSDEIAMVPLTNGLGWSVEQVGELVKMFCQGMGSPKGQPYLTFGTVYGQRPVSLEIEAGKTGLL